MLTAAPTRSLYTLSLHDALPISPAMLAGQRRQVCLRAVAPDLPAGGGVVVEHGDARAARRGGQRRGHAGGAGADDEDVHFHGRLSTRMPSRHRVWQARRRWPSMVTRHSWHTPMPHTGARRWPLTEVRLVPSPPSISAAATVVPSATCRGR